MRSTLKPLLNISSAGSAVWAAIAKTPHGFPDTLVSYSTRFASKASPSVSINDCEVVIVFVRKLQIDLLTYSPQRHSRLRAHHNGARFVTIRCDGEASYPILISQPKWGTILRLWRKCITDKQYIISTISKIGGIGKKEKSQLQYS